MGKPKQPNREALLKSINNRTWQGSYWPFGLFCSAIWIVFGSFLYGWWLTAEVEEEYASGFRTSTDDDSRGPPLLGFIILNFLIVCAINLTIWLYQRRKNVA